MTKKTQPSKYRALHTITTKSFKGYYLEEVATFLGKTQFKVFIRWFAGQTGTMHEGKGVIFKWDFDNFYDKARRIPYD